MGDELVGDSPTYFLVGDQEQMQWFDEHPLFQKYIQKREASIAAKAYMTEANHEAKGNHDRLEKISKRREAEEKQVTAAKKSAEAAERFEREQRNAKRMTAAEQGIRIAECEAQVEAERLKQNRRRVRERLAREEENRLNKEEEDRKHEDKKTRADQAYEKFKNIVKQEKDERRRQRAAPKRKKTSPKPLRKTYKGPAKKKPDTVDNVEVAISIGDSELTFTGSLTYYSKRRKASKQTSALMATGEDGTQYKLMRTTNASKRNTSKGPKWRRTYLWQILSMPPGENTWPICPIFKAEVKKDECNITDNLDIPAAAKWEYVGGADRQRIVVSQKVKVVNRVP